MLPKQITVLKQQLAKQLKHGQVSQAKHCAQTILQHLPKDLGIWFVLGQINESLGENRDAAKAYSEASASTSPHQLKALERLSYLCLELRLYGEALSAADRYLELAPNNAVALQRKGYAICQLKQSEYGLKLIRQAHAAAPSNESIQACLAEVQIALGYIDDALRTYKKNDFYKSSINAFTRYLEAHNYTNQYDTEDIFEHANELELFILQDLEQAPSPAITKDTSAPYDGKRRIRLGYLSPDFRKHSVAHFMHPIYERHNRDVFEIFSYYDGETTDKTTQFFKSQSEHWLDTRSLSDEALAQRIAEDKIDILVDLAVHTATKPRARVLAMQPAAIQVNYLGYPNTAGLSQVTHRLVDAYTDPRDYADQFCTEQIVRLPDGFLCFQPAHSDLAVSSLPALENKFLTFGSFNSGLKITDAMLGLWAQLLELNQSAKLIIKNTCMRDPSSTQAFKERCSKAGLKQDRIQLLPFAEKQADHLALYQQIDIHLDTHPYSGTTTTFEALWMGVPSITLVGESHRSRVSGSILSRLNLSEFIARDETEYLEKCDYWSSKIEELAELRTNMRERLKASKMMDAASFTENLESAFKEMLQQIN